MITKYVSVGLLLAVGSTAGSSAPQQTAGPIEPGLTEALESASDERVFAIVMLEDSSGHASPSQARLDALFEQQERVLASFDPGEFELSYRFRNVPALSGRVSRAGVERLASDPAVRAVGLDQVGTVAAAPLDDSVPFIRADQVHALGYLGEGVTVAVLDTGLDTDHPDLIDDVAPGAWHILDQGADVGPGAEDVLGHGTGVAGVITSKGVVAAVGVAPATDILAVQVIGPSGSGWLVDFAAAVDHVVAHRDEYVNLCAINMSLVSNADFGACPCDDEIVPNMLLQAAIQAARDAGIVTFAASGNTGSCDSMKSPACLSAVEAVAMVYDQDLGLQDYPIVGCTDATTGPDQLVCSSDRLDGCNALAAPGRWIEAPDVGGGTKEWTGTSFATPHCAGVAALMRERAKSECIALSPDEIVAIMKSTAAPTVDACATTPNPARVDALSAVQAIEQPGAAYCFGDGLGAACPCGNESAPGACQGCANSSGSGGLLSTSGSTSAGADDLGCHVSGALPGQPGLLFVGQDTQGAGNGLAFGDGLRCAGVGVVRLAVASPDGAGSMSFGPGLRATGGWVAGDTRYFQCWYRDPVNSPCGSLFNLTSAQEIVFTP